jgi:hypothetical protein
MGGKTAEARKAFEARVRDYRDLARSALSSHEETGRRPAPHPRSERVMNKNQA